ncbi:MAG: hypothetical protein ABIH34_03315 [Nanoarchaeota archaeon]
MRRAQIKMGENIAILFIFFVMLAAGLIFYANMKQSSLQQKFEEIKDLQIVQSAQKIAFLPELQCTRDNVPVSNCIDIKKAQTLALLTDAQEYYRIFGSTKVTIKQIYPDPGDGPADIEEPDIGEEIIYDFGCPDCSQFAYTEYPVSLYNATANRYAFGLLIIETQSK